MESQAMIQIAQGVRKLLSGVPSEPGHIVDDGGEEEREEHRRGLQGRGDGWAHHHHATQSHYVHYGNFDHL